MDDAEWSDWIPFAEALAVAPRVPGVYMAREGETGEIVYIGMAGERAGGGKPQGVRGRLAIYASGKGLASGLGEAVFDRALADPDWVRARLVELETTGPRRAKHWGIEAFARADLHIRWKTTADRATAAALEDRLVRQAGTTLWNKASTRLGTQAAAAATSVPPKSAARPTAIAQAVTQQVTLNDLGVGQIRIPIAHKAPFPNERQELTVVLRGESLTCGWNPQLGPDRERSGLLRPPRHSLRQLVAAEERLVIRVEDGRIILT